MSLVDQLKAELAMERARRMALESVLATNEHLVLKSPAFAIVDFFNRPPWRPPGWERWRIGVSLERERVPSGERFADRFERYFDEVPVRSLVAPRILVCALPEVTL